MISSTFKVQENNVLLFFGLKAVLKSYSHFVIFGSLDQEIWKYSFFGASSKKNAAKGALTHKHMKLLTQNTALKSVIQPSTFLRPV